MMEKTISYLTPAQLSKYLKILAKIEIIMLDKEDEWLRIALFNKISEDTEGFYIDNGSGDNVEIFIKKDSAFIKGFEHENDFSPYQQEDEGKELLSKLYSNAPSDFTEILDDEGKYETTFVMWNDDGTDLWHFNEISSDDDGGREFLLGYIHTTPKSLMEWAEEYHEASLDGNIVSSIYDGKPITEEMIITLNPERNAKEALKEISRLD